MTFNDPIDRNGTHSIKWDYREKLFGKHDILPMWVADMDFESPHAVKQALKKRVEHGIYGYTAESSGYFKGIINWLAKRHQWTIDKDWLHYTPGVIPALNWSVQTFTEPGDKVIIQPPVYEPFFNAIKRNNREIVENPLELVNNAYQMDLTALENVIDDKTRMLILCSPHNPVGRVWTKEELIQLGEICLKHNVLIVSDEIHFDMVYGDRQHFPLGNLSEDLKHQTITLTSPGKTFNLQGFQSAYAIIPDQELNERFSQTLRQNGIFLNNVMSITAVEAAYNHGEAWLDELLPYLEENKEFIHAYSQANLPGIHVVASEGTYLAWLDCRDLGLSQEGLKQFMVEEAGLALNDGMIFGKQGAGFMRLNFGCPRSLLEEGLNRLAHALENLGA